ncbi:MAG: hypothetical protein J2P37_00720, partial [Ktedonobacteraceae bacterium]|nr:hypothetical protein [Ktedonobacteraceae bacterium]
LIAAARASALTDVVAAPPLYVLPIPPTQLIGREQDIARVIALLRGDRARLLTLLGPAGVGKTHLGLDVAHLLRGDFKDGVVFVALAATADAAVVSTLIAQALRLRGSADISPAQQTSNFLAEKHLLLVLDNFEQVIESATYVAELLQNCPHLRILVTSRTPLRLRGEQEMPIAPLALEAAKTLFLQRAQAVRPDIESEDTIVAAICEQVDRLPLAIELAAAQIKVLSLRQLLTRLQRRLPLLKHGTRDAAVRQQTMQAAIAWSDDLLTLPARQLLRIVSLCEGGCSEEALTFLCAEDGASGPGDVLTHLHELVEASLLQSEAAEDGTMRFHLLKLVQEYAQEQLRATGQEALYRSRHLDYFTRLVEEAIMPDRPQREWIEAEQANLRVALQWTYEQRQASAGLRLAAACGAYWIRKGHLHEGDAWLTRMLELDSQASEEGKAPSAVRLAALYCAGGIARHLGEPARSAAIAQEALALGEHTENHVGISNALALLGHLAQARGDLEQASASFEQSYQHALRGGSGDDGGSLGRARDNLATLARAQGDLVRAQAVLEESLAHCRSKHFTWGIARTLALLGQIACEQQQYALAHNHYRESLRIQRRIGNPTSIATILEGMAALSSAEGEHEQAVLLCALASSLRVKAHTPLPPNEEQVFKSVIVLARSSLSGERFAAAWQQGLALTVEDVGECIVDST